MKTVWMRKVEIGVGAPKVIVPIVGATAEEILAAAESFRRIPLDVVEWRADFYGDVCAVDRVLDTLKRLRAALGDTPILFTLRSKKEGGERQLRAEEYTALNRAVAESGDADAIDVEIFSGDDVVRENIAQIHAAGLVVVGSNHDFDKTPDEADLIYRLRKMQDMGADIPKIAVMPRSRRDVLTLLSATEAMDTNYADRPIITMSMSGMGVISRLCGEVFGSAMTFGAVGRLSAPGQIPVEQLNTATEILHRALQ